MVVYTFLFMHTIININTDLGLTIIKEFKEDTIVNIVVTDNVNIDLSVIMIDSINQSINQDSINLLKPVYRSD